MSQCSIASQASTIPYEIIENEDDSFQDELLSVENLYFRPVPAVSPVIQGHNYDSDSDSEDVDEDILSSHDNADTDSDSDSSVNIEFSKSACDIAECDLQNDFLVNSCKCTKLYGEPCSKLVSFAKIVECRGYCTELSREELDLVIKAKLSGHRNSGQVTVGKGKRLKMRERPCQKYYFDSMQVCRRVFCFAHAIGPKKLGSIALSLDTNGLTPRVHGLKHRTANHGKALTMQDHDRIRQFIIRYAKDNALPLPGRLPNFRQSHVYVLPSDNSMSDIHMIYQASAQTMDFRLVSLRSFQRVWHEFCPHITLAKPATDLCQKCQYFSSILSSSGCMSEEEKVETLAKYTLHVTSAKKQRDHYRQQVIGSKTSYSELPAHQQVGGQPPCSYDGSFHYSWDFAQQVHYPHHAQQTGPIFFKTPRKCSIFGVCSEGSGRQIFYLIDESESMKKGANCVTSMVHHYLKWHGLGECDARIHFDNCCGQNKNNTVLWYALWRVMNGLHQKIELSMMIAGHTKFHPDWHFGIWKNRWRNSNAETIDEVATTVSLSSKSGHNQPQLVKDTDKPVYFYEWKDRLSTMFRPLKHLTKYHHFEFQANKPGIVRCKEFVDSEPVDVNLMRRGIAVTDVMPEETEHPGLDIERQWYLYQHIREFCFTTENRDKSCPKPTSECSKSRSASCGTSKDSTRC